METQDRFAKFQERLVAALAAWLMEQEDRRWGSLAEMLGYSDSTMSRIRTMGTPVTEDFVVAVAQKVPGMEWALPEFIAAKFGERSEPSGTIPREAIEAAARSLEAIAEKAAEAARALRSQGLEIDVPPARNKRPRGKGPP